MAPIRPSLATLSSGRPRNDVLTREEENLVCWILDTCGTSRCPIASGMKVHASDFTKNMHELACVSGIAAAYRLGANYDKFDDFAESFFAKYLLLSHGTLFSRTEKRRSKTGRNAI